MKNIAFIFFNILIVFSLNAGGDIDSGASEATSSSKREAIKDKKSLLENTDASATNEKSEEQDNHKDQINVASETEKAKLEEQKEKRRKMNEKAALILLKAMSPEKRKEIMAQADKEDLEEKNMSDNPSQKAAQTSQASCTIS